MAKSNYQIPTGSYAVTTVYSMPWTKKTSSSSKTKTTRGRRKKAEKKVIHPIFEQCSEISEDAYWVSIFRDCARGKFPRGFSYKNSLMTFRRGNKTVRTEITSSPHETLSICISFFKSSAGLMSNEDRERLQKEQEEKLLKSLDVSNLEWKDIRTHRVKEVLLTDYITQLSKFKNFTPDEKKELITTVKSGFMLGYLSSKQILMKDGKIDQIEGINYDDSTRKYFIDPELMTKIPTRSSKDLGLSKFTEKKKVSFMSSWEKYLANLDKKVCNTNFRIVDSKNSFSHSGESLFSGDNTITPTESI